MLKRVRFLNGRSDTDTESFAQNYPAMLQYGYKAKAELLGCFHLGLPLCLGYYFAHVREVRYCEGPQEVYSKLLDLMGGKENYFVITTNVDGLFEKNGFDKNKIYTPQGDYALMQCLKPCTNETWTTLPIIEKHLPTIDPKTHKLPEDGVPKCPNCGGPIFFNVRGGDWFIHKPYEAQAKKYNAWIQENKNKRLLVIDIGSGFNTPVWIRFPSENLVYHNEKANLVRINLHHPEVPDEIADRSLSFLNGALDVISKICVFRGHLT